MDKKKWIKRITGKNVELDSKVSLYYLMQRGVPYVLGLLRGKVKKISLKNSGANFFIGKRVRMLSPRNIVVGNNVRIDSYTTIDALSRNGIVLKNNVKLGEYSKIVGSGSISNIGLGLEIGNNSSFSEYTFFGAAGGIVIGNDVIAGQMVRFHAENHNYISHEQLIREQGVNCQGITVGNNCWIGAGAVFLDGSSIGDGCIVAVNAVVTKKFPDNVIIGGMPEKIIGER